VVSGQRIAYRSVLPDVFKAMAEVHRQTEAAGLPGGLMELMKIRASQINGCAYCIDMHVKDALALGEDPRRLQLLPAWRESGLFTDAEQAGLAWTEALTRLHTDGAPDAVYDELGRHYSQKEIVALTWVVAVINAWNRMGVGTQQPASDYVSARRPAQP
jgi:AhpD family alkylhydroperoxidase